MDTATAISEFDVLLAILLVFMLAGAVLGIILRRLVPVAHPASRHLFSKRVTGPDHSEHGAFLRLRYLYSSARLPEVSDLSPWVPRLVVLMRVAALAALGVLIVGLIGLLE